VSTLLITIAVTASLAATLTAADPAVLDQQNTFVKTHCAVCHNDRANNGGLSLEGFDAAGAAPSLAAMMLSKITSGTALATVNAAGVGVPATDTVDALVAALRGNRRARPGGASSARSNTGTHEGTMQLAWSPIPKEGPLAIAIDGRHATTFKVEGKERMGNGGEVTTGPAAFLFARFGGGASHIELPKRTLTATGLFAGETVTFDELARPARQALSDCFR
jgi:hypothetical protein